MQRSGASDLRRLEVTLAVVRPIPQKHGIWSFQSDDAFDFVFDKHGIVFEH